MLKAMRTDLSRNSAEARKRGFTLMEILVASVMFSVIVGALYSVFHGAIRMRENLYSRFEKELPKRRAVTVIKRDLAGAVIPNGLFCGALIGATNQEGDIRSDSLQLYTDTGIISDSTPWGDVQRIEYYLEAIQNTEESQSKDLVRAISRNLIPSTEEDPVVQKLLHNVRALTFTYYDGEQWQDSWDSTAMNNATPEAVKARVDFFIPEEDQRDNSPIEIIVPIVARAAPTKTGGNNAS